VQAAVDAAADGDNVILPAGDVTWSQVYNHGNYKYCVRVYQKQVVIRGAGKSTVIRDGTGGISGGAGGGLIYISGTQGKPFRITGLTFPSARSFGLLIDGSCLGWRVDRIVWENPPDTYQEGMEVSGTNGFTYGVVDHCDFINSNPATYGDESAAWQRPLTLGTANAIYFEDNRFSNTTPVLQSCSHGNRGIRVVYRRNDIHNMEVMFHGTDGGGARSIHSYEIYDNTFSDDSAANCYEMAAFRGGTGVVYNNAFTGTWITPYNMEVWCTCACVDPSDSRCNWGGKFCVTYPCLDQIGRTSDMNGDGVQDYAPLYVWGNTINGNPLPMVLSGCTNAGAFVQEGRDFVNGTFRPGYTPLTYPHPLRTSGPLSDATLSITNPNGGEAWRKGETRAITWVADEVTGNLVIELLKEGAVAGTIAPTVPVGSGTFLWVVGRLANNTFISGGNLKIRIRTSDGQAVAETNIL